MPDDIQNQQSQQSSLPATLPADFSQWDKPKKSASATSPASTGPGASAAPPPDTLPANFDQWDTKEGGKPNTVPGPFADQKISPAPSPSIWQRVKSAFTQDVPAFNPDFAVAAHTDTGTLVNGEHPEMHLVNPEAAMTLREQQQHPILDEIAKAGAGMTTAPNALMLAAMPGGQIGKLVSLGFSAQQITDALYKIPDIADAVQKGDWDQVKRLGTQGVMDTVFAALAGRHAASTEPTSFGVTTDRSKMTSAPGNYEEPPTTALAIRGPIAQGEFAQTPNLPSGPPEPIASHASLIPGLQLPPGPESVPPGPPQLGRGPLEAPESSLPPQPLLAAGHPPLEMPSSQGGIPDELNFLMGNPSQVPDIPGFNAGAGPLEVNTADHRNTDTSTDEGQGGQDLAPGRTPHPLLPRGAPAKEPISGFHTGEIAPLRPDGEPGVFITTHAPGSVAESVAGSMKGVKPLKGDFALADVTAPQWKEIYDTAKQVTGDPAKALSATETAIKAAGYDGYKNPQIPNSAFIFGDAKLASDKEATQAAAKAISTGSAGAARETVPTQQTKVSAAAPVESKRTVAESLPKRGSVFQQMPQEQLERQAEQGVEGAKREVERRKGEPQGNQPTPSERTQKITGASTNESWTTEQLKSEISRTQKIVNDPRATEEEKRVANNQLQSYQQQFSERQREDSVGEKFRKEISDAANKKAPRDKNGRMGKESGSIPISQIADDVMGLKSKAEDQYARFSHYITDTLLRLSDKYQPLRRHDPLIASEMSAHDNGPAYYRAKAEANLGKIYDALGKPDAKASPEEQESFKSRERLAKLMSDADSRTDLQKNHPDEYKQAIADPRIMDAVKIHQKFAEELTANRKEMGQSVLDQDYSKRVYSKYVAGSSPDALGNKGEPRANTPYDQVVRPGRDKGYSRESSADYFYKNGLHEFGPAYATKYVSTKLMLQDHRMARTFMDRATVAPERGPMPRSIDYQGKKYYAPDVAAEMRESGKKVDAYSVYDPSAGLKYPPSGSQWQQKYLGPAPVVETMNGLAERKGISDDPNIFEKMRRFFQAQVINVGFAVHASNIIRRVMQTHSGGALNPKAWTDAYKVAFSKEFRTRTENGVNDPAFDAQMKYGGMTSTQSKGLKEYVGGNLNPVNWVQEGRQFGHKVLFEPGSAGGFGGLDQRARTWFHDFVKSQDPKLSDSEIANRTNVVFGNYSKLNMTSVQKALSPLMLFPGWDTSSFSWVVQHPLRTTVPAAVLVWAANRVVNSFGANRQDEKDDINAVHLGDRSLNFSLLRDPMAKDIFSGPLNYAASKIKGDTGITPIAKAEQGFRSGIGAVASMLRPELTTASDLYSNRKSPFSAQELNSPEDKVTPGRILPTKAMENDATLIGKNALPIIGRFMGDDGKFDFMSYLGSSVGVPNYTDDALSHLTANTAQGTATQRVMNTLAKTDPAKVDEFFRDPNNRAYLSYEKPLRSLVSSLRQLNEAEQLTNSSTKDNPVEKAAKLHNISEARDQILKQADEFDKMLSDAKANPSGRK